MTDDQIKHMVDKFLAYRFPEDIQPDGGLSIRRVFNEGTPHEFKATPSGTNLLNAAQATDMVRHMLAGLPAPADGALEGLRALSEKATAGPWEADSKMGEDRVRYAVMLSPEGHSMFDSMNVDYRVGLIKSDGKSVKWDETARRNFAFIVACVNYVRTELERTKGSGQ